MNKKTSHIKYCSIKTKIDNYQFIFKDIPYSINFNSSEFKYGKGLQIVNGSGSFVDIDLCLWLTLFFGEDLLDPHSEVDTRFNFIRGAFTFRVNQFDKFINAINKLPRKSYPNWKQNLFEKSFVYFSAAVRSGLPLMPLNMGFFAMSLECIGNVKYGKRDKHYTIGDKHFINLMNSKFKRYKQNVKYKSSTKKFEKFIKEDIELIHKLRNCYYGHSLLHLEKERIQLTNLLRKWYLRTGHNQRFTNSSFKKDAIEKNVTTASHSLYKVGLRVSRLFLFMLIGLTKDIPFASHDFLTIGDMADNEESEYKGIKTRIEISTSAKA